MRPSTSETLLRGDCLLLAAVLKTRTFCVEWFSWTNRAMERSLIFAYPTGQLIFWWHSALARKWWGSAPIFALSVVLVTAMMWHEQRRDTTYRMMKMCGSHWMVTRYLMTFMALVTVAATLPSPHRWFDVVYPIPAIAMAIFHYSTSLPDRGDSGRRRKAALAKLKSKFGGIGWSTAPQGGAA